jgi:hypothetical protein
MPEVVPLSMPHRSPGMSTRDVCLEAASGEARGSVRVEPLAVDLCGPLSSCMPVAPATNEEYLSPPSFGPICRLFCAACSSVLP